MSNPESTNTPQAPSEEEALRLRAEYLAFIRGEEEALKKVTLVTTTPEQREKLEHAIWGPCRKK